MSGDSDPRTVAELKQREKAAVRKIHNLLWERRWGEEMKETRNATIRAVAVVAAVAGGLKLFRPKGLLNVPIGVSVAIGAGMHWVNALSRNVQTLCDSDTPLGNNLRSQYQRISEYNILIPHYRAATIKAAKARTNTN